MWHLTRLVTKDMASKADKASHRMKETNHVFANKHYNTLHYNSCYNDRAEIFVQQLHTMGCKLIKWSANL